MRPEPISPVSPHATAEASRGAGELTVGSRAGPLSCQQTAPIAARCDCTTRTESPAPPSSPLACTPVSSTPLLFSRSSRNSEASPPAKAQIRVRSTFSLPLLKKYIANEPDATYGFVAKVQEGGISALLRAETLLWVRELITFHDGGDDVFVLTAQLLDKLLAATKMKPKHLRVAAVACFLIASKCIVEEADQPLLGDLVANCSPEFTTNDLKRMELVVLAKLHWQLPSRSSVSMVHDLIAFVVAELHINPARIDDVVDDVVAKFVDCTVSYELLRFKPSVVAASILIPELSGLTRLSEDFICALLENKLSLSSSHIHHCSPLLSRHLRATAALHRFA